VSIITITSLLYICTSVVFIIILPLRKTLLLDAARVLFLASVVSHGILMGKLFLVLHEIPLSSVPQALNMMIFISSVVFIPIVLSRKTYLLGVFFLPFASFVLMWVFPNIGLSSLTPFRPHTYWYPLHTMSVIIGEAMFVVAAVTSLVYLVHESIIKKGDFHSSVSSSLPALTLLDRILYMSVLIGFVAITSGMIIGTLWAQSKGLALPKIMPKIVAGGIVWVIFAVCLHQRFAIGWRGRRTAIAALIGFIVMMVLLFLINMLFPHAHGPGLLL